MRFENISNLDMKVKYIFLSLFFLSFLLVLPAWAQRWQKEAEKQEKELNSIRKELEHKRKKVTELKDKEGMVFTQLQNIGEELELIGQLVKRLDRRLKKVKRELGEENQKLELTQVDLKKRRELLAGRIRGIYKYARFNKYQIVFGSSSLVDLLKRSKYMQLVAKEDNKLIDGFLKEKDKSEKSKRSLEAKKNELYALKREKQREEKNRAEEKKRRQRVLNRIRSEEKLYLQAVRELETSAKKIEAFLVDYEKERRKEEDQRDLFKILKGRLDWPVKGKVISSFGEQKHPIFKTITFNQGIDIGAKPDTKVKAVADGRVIYSSWLRGRGRFLILQHEYGYYTIYADLGEVLVEEGQKIKEGQTIASVGEGGLLLDSGLHFELRKGKKQLDPLEWLKQ